MKKVFLSGFTLIEMSVVLVIIALITGMAITGGIATIATARQSSTVKKMAAIDAALMAFRIANNRLPCPADLTRTPSNSYYGVEAGAATAGVTSSTVPSSGVGNGVCTGNLTVNISGTPTSETLTPAANLGYSNSSGTVRAAEGGVPTVALGLPNDFMYDGWGNRINYAVDVGMTTTGAFSATPVGALCGTISVCDASGGNGAVPTACIDTARSNPTNIGTLDYAAFSNAGGAIYALLSYGPNGHGAYTQNGQQINAGTTNINELLNAHQSSAGTATTYAPFYVQQNLSLTPGSPLNSFDDIVTFKTRPQMQTSWDKRGLVCPALWAVDVIDHYIKALDARGNLLFYFGTVGSGKGQVTLPKGITTDTNGNIWVADYGNNRVVEFNNRGLYTQTIPNICVNSSCSPSSSPGQFNEPSAIVSDANGNVWVVDYGNSRVQKFTPNGNWLLTIGNTSGSGNGQFSSSGAGLGGIAVDSNGNLWVADGGKNRVQKFNASGQWLLTVGGGPTCTACVSATSCSCSSGTTAGMFSAPGSIAVDAYNNLWVADASNNRVVEFNSTGAYLQTIPSSCVNSACTASSSNGQFDSIMGLAVDGYGNLWVGDAGNSRIQELSGNAGGTLPATVTPVWQRNVSMLVYNLFASR